MYEGFKDVYGREKVQYISEHSRTSGPVTVAAAVMRCMPNI